MELISLTFSVCIVFVLLVLLHSFLDRLYACGIKLLNVGSIMTNAADSPPSIKLATYNIAGGNKKLFRHERILEVLESLNADVICLQEVCGESVEDTQAHHLANDLRMNCMFGRARDRGGGVFGNAILSRYPITRRQEIELPRGSLMADDGKKMPGQKEGRLALAAIVSPFPDVRTSDFLCICTHVGIYNSAEKASEAQRPAEIIGNLVNSKAFKDTPAVLAGDLNCAWTEPFTGVVARLHRNWHIYPSAGTRTSKSKDKGNKVDYICDRGRGRWRLQDKTMQAVRNSVTSPGKKQAPSDHLPLVAFWQRISEPEGRADD